MKQSTQSHRSEAPVSIRVLLVDDHPAIREGLALLLGPEDIMMCGEAGGCADALAAVENSRPNVAIVDLSLEGEDGRRLIADLHRSSIPVMVYSMHDDARHVASALAAGALGYVTKRASHSALVQGIREVAAGRRFVCPVAAAALAESLTVPSDGDAIGKLSAHERKVYELLGKGANTFDIAAALAISTHTVESYYSRILVKVSLSGMHQLRRHAIAHVQKHIT